MVSTPLPLKDVETTKFLNPNLWKAFSFFQKRGETSAYGGLPVLRGSAKLKENSVIFTTWLLILVTYFVYYVFLFLFSAPVCMHIKFSDDVYPVCQCQYEIFSVRTRRKKISNGPPQIKVTLNHRIHV